jgi:hypothetical protein
MPNLQRIFSDNNAFNDQLQYLLFFIERSLIQPTFDERTKGANVLQHLLGVSGLQA